MEHVKDILAILEHKEHECLTEEGFTYDALKLMERKGIGCILVVRDGLLVGLFSEQVYAKKVVIKGLSSWKSVLKTIMQTDFPTVTPETTMEECKELFELDMGRYLPVKVGEKVIGIISIEDVDKALMRQQYKEIELLKDYVYSRHC